MPYRFFVDAYETERLKTLGLWSAFHDDDMPCRPHPDDRRGRSVHEQMVHQCVSENLWFINMFGIDTGAPPLPEEECRMGFIRRYAEDSEKRLAALRGKEDAWWEESVSFFGAARSRAWVMLRRFTHTAHHRGQLTAMLRMLGRAVHSTYGPTADTGGLMRYGAPTIYPYPDMHALLEDGDRAPLPGPGDAPPTERPDAT